MFVLNRRMGTAHYFPDGQRSACGRWRANDGWPWRACVRKARCR